MNNYEILALGAWCSGQFAGSLFGIGRVFDLAPSFELISKLFS